MQQRIADFFHWGQDAELALYPINNAGADKMRLCKGFVQLIKRIYDWSVLDELRDGQKYLSDAKVKVYLQHKAELKELKMLMKVDLKAYKASRHEK